MCHISPEHVPLLKGFGSIMLIAGGLSIATGKTYFRRVIERAEEPFDFWSTALGMLVLGSGTWLGLLIC